MKSISQTFEPNPLASTYGAPISRQVGGVKCFCAKGQRGEHVSRSWMSTEIGSGLCLLLAALVSPVLYLLAAVHSSWSGKEESTCSRCQAQEERSQGVLNVIIKQQTHTHTHTHTHIHAHIHTHTHAYKNIQRHTYIQTNTHRGTHTCTEAHTDTRACNYSQRHAHKHTFAHTHTPTNKNTHTHMCVHEDTHRHTHRQYMCCSQMRCFPLWHVHSQPPRQTPCKPLMRQLC